MRQQIVAPDNSKCLPKTVLPSRLGDAIPSFGNGPVLLPRHQPGVRLTALTSALNTQRMRHDVC